MKTLLFFCFMAFAITSKAQVLCIECYNQNPRVINDTNNLVLNSGFENSTCIPDVSHSHSFCPNSSVYDCDFPNWTCTGGGSNTYASLLDSAVATNYSISIIAQGNYAAYFGNGFCNACSASITDTSCISNLACVSSGVPSGYPYNGASYGYTGGVSLEQTISGLTPGVAYTLEFWTGGEWQVSFAEDGLFAIDLGFGNILLRDPATPPITGIGRRYVIVFAATASSHTIKFTNWGHIGGQNPYKFSELILDDVRMYEMNATPCTQSISTLSESQEIDVYPNPVSGQLNINMNNSERSTVVLYDIYSRKIFEQTFIDAVKINTEQLPGGLYFYEVTNSTGKPVAGKIIKN